VTLATTNKLQQWPEVRLNPNKPCTCATAGGPASVTYGVCFKSCYCSCFCYAIADTLQDNELEGCIHRLPQEAHRYYPDPQAAELMLIKIFSNKPVASIWKYKIVCVEDRGRSLLRNIGTYPPDYTALHSRIPYSWSCLPYENKAPYTNYFLWLCSPARAMTSFTRFLDQTQRRATVGRTPPNEWSSRRRGLYMTTHNKHPCHRTHDRSRRAAVHLRLRPRGHWDRHLVDK
jgi:hypothetical protein